MKIKVRITTHYFPFIFLLNFLCCVIFFSSSVLWRCRLGIRKSIWPVKNEWWGAGVVICMEQGASDLHMVQLMPLTATQSSCALLKSRLVWPFRCRVSQVVLEKKSLNGCLSVCWILFLISFLRWTKILHNAVLSYVGTEFAFDVTEFK